MAHDYRGKIAQLTLRGRTPRALLQSDDDWQVLGTIATRMLFWCGGQIYGCRCEANEMRFAIQVAHAPIGAMAQHLSAAYAHHLRRQHGWHGRIFKHYVATPLHDEVFLDDLVLWLHRSATRIPREIIPTPVFTADDAYLHPHANTWTTTDRVLQSLSIGAPGPAAYRRRKAQQIPPAIIDLLTRRTPRARSQKHNQSGPSKNADPLSQQLDASSPRTPRRPNVEAIAQAVADRCHVSLDDMRSTSRRRHHQPGQSHRHRAQHPQRRNRSLRRAPVQSQPLLTHRASRTLPRNSAAPIHRR